MARLAGVQKAYYSPGAGPGFEAGHIGECLAPLAGRGTSEGPARQGLTRGIPLRGGGPVCPCVLVSLCLCVLVSLCP
jgi:hypothetical protein